MSTELQKHLRGTKANAILDLVAGEMAIAEDQNTVLAMFDDGSTIIELPSLQRLDDVGVGVSGASFSGVDETGLSEISGSDVQAVIDSIDNALSSLSSASSGFTEGSVLFADSSGNIAQDNANLFWDNTANRLDVNSLKLTKGSQDYLFTDRGDSLVIQGQDLGKESSVDFFSKEGGATDNVYLRIWGKGTPSNIVDSERLQIGWSSSLLKNIISSRAFGTGTIPPISIHTGSNTNQLLLSTDGNSSFSGNLSIGDGSAGVDNTLTWNGETNDGLMTWMEDEDLFKFSDDLLIDGTERLYLGSKTFGSFIQQDSGDNLVIENFAGVGSGFSDIKINSGCGDILFQEASSTKLKYKSGGDWTFTPSVIFENGIVLPLRSSTSTSNTINSLDDHTLIIDATSGNKTVFMALGSQATGKVQTIKKIDSTANTVIISCNASKTIDGATSHTLSSQWDKVSIQYDGTNWVIV